MGRRSTRLQLARDSRVVVLRWRYQTIRLGCRLGADFASAATKHPTERLFSGKYGADEMAVCKPGKGFIFSFVESQPRTFTHAVNGIFKQIHNIFFFLERLNFVSQSQGKENCRGRWCNFNSKQEQKKPKTPSTNSSVACPTSLFVIYRPSIVLLVIKVGVEILEKIRGEKMLLSSPSVIASTS